MWLKSLWNNQIHDCYCYWLDRFSVRGNKMLPEVERKGTLKNTLKSQLCGEDKEAKQRHHGNPCVAVFINLHRAVNRSSNSCSHRSRYFRSECHCLPYFTVVHIRFSIAFTFRSLFPNKNKSCWLRPLIVNLMKLPWRCIILRHSACIVSTRCLQIFSFCACI